MGARPFVRRVPLEVRFWAKVVKHDEASCWDWTGAGGRRGGYGQVFVDGRNEPAHKVAWMLHHRRAFPAGMDACHSCDNPRCVNPLHVWPGSRRDNMRDAREKGRLRPWNAGRPTCRLGHPLEGDNVYTGSGRRRCRTCSRAQWHRRQAKKRAALRASEPTQ